MLERLDVPFRDASAAQLVWELDAAPQPCLARRTTAVGDLAVELRLLGASHQVLVRDDAGRSVCSELVACRPGTPGALPALAEADRGGLRYRFSSDVEHLADEALASRAEELLAHAADDPSLLVGSFPGSPHAVTAIEVTPTGWRTWHVYPQSAEIVTTVTTFSGTPASPARMAP